MDINSFAHSINLTPNQVMTDIHGLAKQGYVCKVGNGYAISEKGKNALRAFTPLEENLSFHFYTRIGYPTVFSAQSLADFYRLSEQIEVESLEFHLYRGDFQNWLKDVYCDEELAQNLQKLKDADVKGENLRNELLCKIDQKYDIKGLL